MSDILIVDDERDIRELIGDILDTVPINSDLECGPGLGNRTTHLFDDAGLARDVPVIVENGIPHQTNMLFGHWLGLAFHKVLQLIIGSGEYFQH